MSEVKDREIELLDNNIQDLLGSVPPWIIRWGITLVFGILLAIIGFTCIIRYPDVLVSSIEIVSENPPTPIVARGTGRIQEFKAKNNQVVSKGDVLMILESTADYRSVLSLRDILTKLKDTDYNGKLPPISGNFSLGSVQGSFSLFYIQYQEFQNFLVLDIYNKKAESLRREIADYNIYIKKLKVQLSNSRRILQLHQRRYNRDSILYRSVIISPAELEASEQILIQTKNSYESIAANIANAEISINQLSYQLTNLDAERLERKQSLKAALLGSTENLLHSISEWEKATILTAPINGRVTLTKYWAAEQFVQQGETVCKVVPLASDRILGRVKVPVSGSGKVKVNQRVNIKLENYPYMEFGTLAGRVESIALVPETNEQGPYYSASVSLINGLKTDYSNEIPFKQQMQGIAEIITNDITLFERFLQPLKALAAQSKTVGSADQASTPKASANHRQ